MCAKQTGTLTAITLGLGQQLLGAAINSSRVATAVTATTATQSPTAREPWSL